MGDVRYCFNTIGAMIELWHDVYIYIYIHVYMFVIVST